MVIQLGEVIESFVWSLKTGYYLAQIKTRFKFLLFDIGYQDNPFPV